MGRMRSDAQLMIYLQFLPGFPWPCFSWQDPPFEEKSCGSKTCGFSSNILSLALGISPCFLSLISSLWREEQLGKSPLTKTSLLWGGLFLNVVIRLFNLLTSMKTGCTYIDTTENAQFIYFLTICGQFCDMSKPLHDDDFTIDLTQGEKLIGIFYNIFRGNSDKNLHFPSTNVIFIHLW